ncbi:hypothetical protein [Gluconobacter thailandicus]|uniref:hypothetical protein n=1 Tax=Gluconobacter thailandicus TaxID=257438 RepID=UPI0014301709|nr:hypothetical protein [Gluconobacter thailandicus]
MRVAVGSACGPVPFRILESRIFKELHSDRKSFLSLEPRKSLDQVLDQQDHDRSVLRILLHWLSGNQMCLVPYTKKLARLDKIAFRVIKKTMFFQHTASEETIPTKQIYEVYFPSVFVIKAGTGTSAIQLHGFKTGSLDWLTVIKAPLLIQPGV